ncbi:MAG: hypothetical protein RBT71_10205 [Flavobacteriales bacterium]|jgi:hypothetical protein|nr:hypothetical protein [Flavobacteriales bacterium]
MSEGRAALVAGLNRIEEEFPVEEIVLDDAHVWPVLRVFGGTFHLQRMETVASVVRPRRPVLARLWDRLRPGHGPIAPRTGTSSGPLVFISQHTHRVVHQGATVDKFAHPMMEAAARAGLASVLVLLGGVAGPPIKPVAGARMLHLDRTRTAVGGRAWRRARVRTGEVPGMADVLALMGRAGIVVEARRMEGVLRAFLSELAFHRLVLAGLRPGHVFMPCWYGPDHMAAVQVCRELGIVAVDIQHGVQGPAHLAYGRWATVPAAGWSTMPHRFWCWDRYSVDNIARWAPPGMHRPFLGGWPWLEQRHAGPVTGTAPGVKRVLFSLQPMAHPLPPGFGAVVRALGTGYHWVFRTHPRTGADIAAHPELHGLEGRFSMEDTREVPLAASLGHTDVHLTQYSSVTIEAALCGVPSVALHPHATELFPEHVRDGWLRVTGIDALSEALATARAPEVAPTRSAPLEERLVHLLHDRNEPLPGGN